MRLRKVTREQIQEAARRMALPSRVPRASASPPQAAAMSARRQTG